MVNQNQQWLLSNIGIANRDLTVIRYAALIEIHPSKTEDIHFPYGEKYLSIIYSVMIFRHWDFSIFYQLKRETFKIKQSDPDAWPHEHRPIDIANDSSIHFCVALNDVINMNIHVVQIFHYLLFDSSKQYLFVFVFVFFGNKISHSLFCHFVALRTMSNIRGQLTVECSC